MTATGKALEYVYSSLLWQQSAGARDDAAKVVFVLTDGYSNRGVKPSIPATKLKNKEAVVFVVGISGDTNQAELESIATQPTSDEIAKGVKYVFRIHDYATLNEIIKLLKTL